jgi:diguanylate cyclase (GGDEF)-like protein
MLSVDVDNLKGINDRWGHEAGDDVLLGVASILRDRLRASDVLARIGGDEFAVLLPLGTEDRARTVAEGVRLAVSNRALIAVGQRLQVSVSVGFAATPSGELSPADLRRRADAALYVAKTGGRDRVAAWQEDLAADRSS